jgi:hypothetical protein
MQKTLFLGSAAALGADNTFMKKMLDDMEVYFHGQGAVYDPVYF